MRAPNLPEEQANLNLFISVAVSITAAFIAPDTRNLITRKRGGFDAIVGKKAS